MEEKQLKFDRPLLSLRRFPSTVSTKTDEKKKSLPNVPSFPSSEPELKSSGPVSNPGTVPFLWEQFPGRPKAESHTHTRSPIIIPRPPPGRVLKAKTSVPQNVNEKQVVSSVVENAGIEEKKSPDLGDGGKVYVDACNTLSSDRFSTISPKTNCLQPAPGVAAHEKRSMCVRMKMEPCDCRDTVIHNSNQVRYWSESRNLEGTSLYRRLQDSGISMPESENRFRELLVDRNTDMETSLGSPMAEKTVYVDDVHKAPKSNSFSSYGKGIPYSINYDSAITARTRGSEETSSVGSSLRRIAKAKVMDEEVILLSKRLNPAHPSALSSSCKSDQEAGMEMLKGFGQDQRIAQTTIISLNSELPNNGYVDFEDKLPLTKVGNEEICHGIDVQLPVLPPLPKSPSESWLCRTLPNMSSRNSSSRSHLDTRMISPHKASN